VIILWHVLSVVRAERNPSTSRQSGLAPVYFGPDHERPYSITVNSTSQTTSIHDISMHGTVVTSIVNESSVTSVNEESATNFNELSEVCASSVTPINTVSESISTFPMSESTSSCSISVSLVSYPSVSYIHSFGPPPLILRTSYTEAVRPLPLASTDTSLLLPTLSHLKFGTSTIQSFTRVPTVNTRTTEPPIGTPPTV